MRCKKKIVIALKIAMQDLFIANEFFSYFHGYKYIYTRREEVPQCKILLKNVKVLKILLTPSVGPRK